MIKTNYPFILASASPRRKKLLQQLNISFKILKVDINEKIKKGIVITADTIVVLNKEIINKPVDEKDAEKILKKLSGKTHIVYTGFSISNLEKEIFITDYEKTYVTFRELNNKEIWDYIKTGSPMDKAGAYGIQDDFGAVFVKKINGCYYNVVGLPLTKIYTAILKVI